MPRNRPPDLLLFWPLRRTFPMKKRFARWLLARLGWRIEGARPSEPRYVLIAAPHTSNWDFPLMLLFAAAYEIKVTWMAKDSLFWPPLGWAMRAMGGMPITRHTRTGVVDSMVDAFSLHQNLVLVVPTEGTRARADYWKSGFYHIARQAGVPIVPSFLDFGSMRGGFGEPIPVTGNVPEDMARFRTFYHGMRGKHVDLFGPILLREEGDD